MLNCHFAKTHFGNNRARMASVFVVAALTLCLSACAKNNSFTIDLMPAPDVYTDGSIDLFSGRYGEMEAPVANILYATDRQPDDQDDHFYLNERGLNLRLGLAKVALGKEGYTWEEARRISLLKNRTDKYPLLVAEVNELGILDRTFTVFTPPENIPDQPHSAARKFSEIINRRLSAAAKKDIFIYVHGYKVVFDNPMLVSTELWHFLGYDGVFIAFAWPTTPSKWAYFSDLETAQISAHNLRVFLQYLADETNVDRIHIIAYSAGTRLAVNALHQLALRNHAINNVAVKNKLRIGQLILIGSDIDRQLFGAYLVDDFLKVVDRATIYVSSTDKALGFSEWLLRRERLGQTKLDFQNPRVLEYLKNEPKLHLIDVTGVEGSTSGNGHGYFRRSPLVSSDILMSLLYNLEPQDRGLERLPGQPLWDFPDDYIQRLRKALQVRHVTP